MKRAITASLLLSISVLTYPQEKALKVLLADSSMLHGTISFSLIDGSNGSALYEYNPEKSLTPASIMKLLTSSAALELFGPDYTFRTSLGYTGKLNVKSGRLDGNIIITGGGDPCLGSLRFPDQYQDFIVKWTDQVRKAGIRKIEGRVITDDSYFDFMPVPAKWLWEDAGNFYGAGAYGLSLFDNTYEIHFRTSPDSSSQIIIGIDPPECNFQFMNWLVAAGTSDEGYVFAAPYSTNGWLAGSIPVSPNDYVLKASIADPPLIMAKVLDKKLRDLGIRISASPSTERLLQNGTTGKIVTLTEVTSPPLKDIITALNHESINLYAEHLAKELGKRFRQSGSTAAGVDVVKEFLKNTGVNTDGVFIEDGSGLSPLDAINSRAMTSLLLYMKNKCKYYTYFFGSLPEAGKEGTLKNRFTDPLFEGRMSAKSGSMTRVRSYAGYLKSLSGKDLIFCIIVNNFNAPSGEIIAHIEEILKETILNN